MWYKEALAIRAPLFVFAVVVLVIGSFNAWGAGDSGGIYLSQAIDAATVAVCVLALVIGTSLGRELRDSARSALLRPVSRVAYAWGVFSVDLAALIVGYLIGLAAIAGTYELAHGFAAVDLRGVSVVSVALLPIGAALSFYGIAAACGVATRGARWASMLIGPVALTLWCGASIYAWHAAVAFRFLCTIDPMMYLFTAIEHIEKYAHPQTVGSLNNGFFDALPVGADTTMLFAIGAAMLLIASSLWKRAEAQ